MAQLTIKGHPTRGSEVIALLEMLGGINEQECDGTNDCLWYSIDGLNEITFFTHTFNSNNHKFFTLEEFLEKFPYKVGDKVYYDNKVCNVIEIRWNSNLNTISYGVCDAKVKNLAIVAELKPYKEETMEELRIDFPEGYGYAGIENKQVIFTKIEPQYPKTYERCCNILKYSGNYYISLATKIDDRLFEAFYKLKVCRDAYWKIAGNWKPDWEENDGGYRYCIRNQSNKIVLSNEWLGENYILSFPTEEMRDAFYENFKDLIEQCKELL